VPASPDMSVVICSLNGAAGVQRCLRLVASQTIIERLEVIVVDDGSTDDTSEVAIAEGVVVIRHESNRGLSAARNTGVLATTAPIVAFLDDDCEPEQHWAERLLDGYEDPDVVGVGGSVVPQGGAGYMGRFLERHNPLAPLEYELARSERLPYRIALYLRRQWRSEPPNERRRMYSLVGANMSFRREALTRAGMFDERFRLGSDELDLCRRVNNASPDGRLLLEPSARVVHRFEPSLRDTLRRSRAYGVGAARMYRKWPTLRPTVFPFPFVMVVVLASCARRPRLLPLALCVPHLMFPGGILRAAQTGSVMSLLDPAVLLAQEAASNVGFFAEVRTPVGAGQSGREEVLA
jgi:glycosyltransferase involved in cell wall biosynthesis